MAETITKRRTDYSSEAELVADLEQVCIAYGWSTVRELAIRITDAAEDESYVWGRLDLLARRAPTPYDRRPKPLLIEAKHVIRTVPELRRAVQQAHGYRAAMGIRANVMVVAAVFCDIPTHFIEGTYQVKVVDVEYFEPIMATSAYIGTDRVIRAKPYARDTAQMDTLVGVEERGYGSSDDMRKQCGTKPDALYEDQGRKARKAWRESRWHDPSDDYTFPVTVRKVDDD